MTVHNIDENEFGGLLQGYSESTAKKGEGSSLGAVQAPKGKKEEAKSFLESSPLYRMSKNKSQRKKGRIISSPKSPITGGGGDKKDLKKLLHESIQEIRDGKATPKEIASRLLEN